MAALPPFTHIIESTFPAQQSCTDFFCDGSGIPLTRMHETLQAALAHELAAIRFGDKTMVEMEKFDFYRNPDERLIAILNTSPITKCEGILASPSSDHQNLTDKVRYNIFTF